MGQETKLAAAYARLVGQGTVTVRKLKAEAGTSTDSAAAFLREVTSHVDVPPSPDLGGAVNIVWAAAWKEAVDQVRREFTERLDAALESQRVAEVERDAAEEVASVCVVETKDLRDQLAAAVQRADLAERELEAVTGRYRDLERLRVDDRERAVRAEAALDELRGVLDTLRPKQPARPKPAAKTKAKPAASKTSG